jgi:HPt (histidine-containing phosphotransfer) domain-containing protein
LDALAGCTPEPGSERIAVTAPEGFEKLSRDYLTRRKEAVPAFRNSLESGDYDRIRRMAHDIKGTGASYGFPPITNVGRVLEQAAVAGDLARLEHALRSMERYLDAVELKPRGSDGSEAGL